MEIALLRPNFCRSSSQSDECKSVTMREGEKEEFCGYFKRSPRPLFTKIRKVTMSQAMATILLFIWVVTSEYDKIRSNFAEKCQSYSVTMCSYSIFKRVLLSTLTSVVSDLFNYALRLDNELSARPPCGRHGLWTGLKTQMGCLKIVWWNQ